MSSPSTSYSEYLEIAGSPDAETLRLRLDRFAQRHGFPLSNATCVKVASNGQRKAVGGVRTAPAAASPMNNDLAAADRDPVMKLIRHGSRPVSYDQALYVQNGCGDLWEEQEVFGYRTGITAVLHIGVDRHFYMGLDRPDPLPQDSEALMRLMADLQLLATFVQDTAMRFAFGDERLAEKQAIRPPSGRELEVLKWAAAGKTAWETGMILSISDSTVNKHISAAMRLLGCASKAQAVAKASSLGIL